MNTKQKEQQATEYNESVETLIAALEIIAGIHPVKIKENEIQKIAKEALKYYMENSVNDSRKYRSNNI